MILLDAYALIAFLVGGPAAGHVRAVLREGNAGVATANLVEVLDVSNRLYGLPVDRALDVLDADACVDRRMAAVGNSANHKQIVNC